MTREEAISKLHELIECTIDRGMIDDICYEIIEFLEAQEPRVMTLDEICSSGRPFAVYAENWDGELFQVANIGGKYLDINGKQCPEHVRFWTSRPTDEQRKAVPWDE